MPQDAISIGSKVRITRVRDRIPAATVEALKADPTGIVRDYKMTDGTGVGVVVELTQGPTLWFFEDEVVPA